MHSMALEEKRKRVRGKALFTITVFILYNVMQAGPGTFRGEILERTGVVGELGSRAQTLKCVRIKKMKCTHKNNLVYTENSR